jgi:hypothetical protein
MISWDRTSRKESEAVSKDFGISGLKAIAIVEGLRKLHSEELRYSYSSSRVVRIIK